MVDAIRTPLETQTAADEQEQIELIDATDEIPVPLEDGTTDTSYELIEGELVPRVRTDNEHGTICGRAIGLFRLYTARTDQKARISDSSTAFYTRGDDKTARKPDAAFTFYSHLPTTIQSVEDYMRVPPDLVVEVISPGNSATEIETKTQEWFAFGAKLVWLVFPEPKRIHIYPNANQSYILRADDKIDGRDILAGFEAPISAFFED
ncbi:MAG: Uma2 family endonuclease [Aggregatilineales bacterium]